MNLLGAYSWLADVQKASGSEVEELERIQAMMSRFDRKISAVFMESVRRLADRIDVKLLADLLERGRASEALALVNERLLIDGFKPIAVEASYLTIIAAREAAEAASRIEVLGTLRFVFSATTTEIVDYLRHYEMDLIREMSAAALASVHAAIVAGVQGGRNPRDVARDVRAFIGLTEAQARAVMNFRRSLETRDRQALDRALRDKRFDATILRSIRERRPLTPEQIERMTARYRDRYLKYRAETIARTEALRAANGGAHMAWRQMVKEGKIPADAINRRWQYTHDDRTRPAHRATPAMNPAGVGMEEPFKTPDGPLLYPGDPKGPPEATINCRCTVLYTVDVLALEDAAV